MCFLALILAALALLTGGVVAVRPAPLSSQPALPPVYCGDLPPADCDLLRSAVDRLSEVEAAAFDLTYGSYAYHGADGSTDLLFTLTATGTAQARSGSLLAALGTFATSMDADLTVELVLGEPLRARFAAFTAGPVRVVLADSAVYRSPASADGAPGWGRYALAAAPAPAPTQAAEERAVEWQPLVTGLDPIALEAALGPEIARRYVTVTRSDYNNSAMFVTEVDIPGLYADPDFLALWAERAAERGVASPDFDRLSATAAAILPPTLKVMRYGVDPQTGYLNHMDTWMLLDTTVMLEAALRGHDVTAWDMSSITLTLDLRDINAVPPVAPPAEAVPITAEAIRDDPVWLLFLPGLSPAQTGN